MAQSDRDFLPVSDDLALKLLDVLNIDHKAQPVKNLHIVMDAGQVAEVIITRYVRRGEFREMVEVLEQYKLVPKE